METIKTENTVEQEISASFNNVNVKLRETVKAMGDCRDLVVRYTDFLSANNPAIPLDVIKDSINKVSNYLSQESLGFMLMSFMILPKESQKDFKF